jgi:hypothetical protein
MSSSGDQTILANPSVGVDIVDQDIPLEETIIPETIPPSTTLPQTAKISSFGDHAILFKEPGLNDGILLWVHVIPFGLVMKYESSMRTNKVKSGENPTDLHPLLNPVWRFVHVIPLELVITVIPLSWPKKSTAQNRLIDSAQITLLQVLLESEPVTEGDVRVVHVVPFELVIIAPKPPPVIFPTAQNKDKLGAHVILFHCAEIAGVELVTHVIPSDEVILGYVGPF